MSPTNAPAAWRSTDAAVPLRAWRDSELAAIAAALAPALQAWEAAWGLPRLPKALRCATAEDRAHAPEWLALGMAGPAAAWMALEPSFEERLARQLWGVAPPTSPIACEVQAQCREDLRARLARALEIERAGAALAGRGVAPARAWSGSVDASFAWGARLRLDGELACKVLRACGAAPGRAHDAAEARRPLTRVDDAVTRGALTLTVHLADCELAVGSLQDLQVGDVVRVKHALDAPLQVRDPHGRAVFGGFLARSRGFKAVELAALAPAGAHFPEKVLP